MQFNIIIVSWFYTVLRSVCCVCCISCMISFFTIACILTCLSSCCFSNLRTSIHVEPAEVLKVIIYILTLSPPNKLSSAKFLVCFNFQSASMLLKVGENVVPVSNSLDLDETPSNSASHPDPSCFHMAL